MQWFRAANPIELPPGASVYLDARLLLFTAACGIAASMIFAMFPAWRVTRVDSNTAIESHASSVADSSLRATSSLVVMQVAVSMVLLAGAALVSESLWNLTSENLGFRTDHLFTARINLPQETYANATTRVQFASRLDAQLTSTPGVLSATIGSDYVPRGMNEISVAG
jgi:hypothetical protein